MPDRPAPTISTSKCSAAMLLPRADQPLPYEQLVGRAPKSNSRKALQTRPLVAATQIAPGLCLALHSRRGRRECRMQAAPATLACKEVCTLRTQATTGQPEQTAFPAQCG